MDGTHHHEEVLRDAHLHQLKVPFDLARFRWSHVEPQVYKFALGDQRGMGWRGVTRFTLLRPDDASAKFSFRYFELAPGGYSSFEKHAHVHAIIVLRGVGKAIVGLQAFDIAAFDLVYVPPQTPHRWVNEGNDPFGFICPVDAPRDSAQPLSDAEWDTVVHSPVTAPYAF